MPPTTPAIEGLAQLADKGPALLAEFIRATPGMTQAKLAMKIGCQQPEISAYCDDRRRPGNDRRVVLELVTGGKVPALSWMRGKAARAIRPDDEVDPRDPRVVPDGDPPHVDDVPTIDRGA